MISVKIPYNTYFELFDKPFANTFSPNHGLREFMAVFRWDEVADAFVLLSPEIIMRTPTGLYDGLLMMPTYQHMFYNCKIQPSSVTVSRKFNTVAYYISTFSDLPNIQLRERLFFAANKLGHESFVLGLFVLLSLNSCSRYIVDWENFEDVIWCDIPFKSLLYPVATYCTLLTCTW